MDSKAILTDFIQREFIKGRQGILDSSEDLLSSGVLDSLAILQLVSFIEKQFQRDIPVDDIVYENFYSVDAIVGYLATAR